jgi:hypothetical protein
MGLTSRVVLENFETDAGICFGNKNYNQGWDQIK